MPNSPRRVLGVDPGLGSFGWAVVTDEHRQPVLVASGCLHTTSQTTTSERLQELYQQLVAIMSRYRPESMAIEELFFSKNVSTAMVVGQARGIGLLAAAKRHLPVQEFTPTRVKLTVTGDGRADKKQVQRMIAMLLSLPRAPKSDDEADAVAVALCGWQTRPLVRSHG
ncbi:MAG: crossover junction endodeoxyribonuclease RuvC [Candidatus Kerfeldbacteria bacterium]|nr:crossover junction endodeoxyribonuclease RuvC [Candidatus Kerfeldbacteria bacterium]